MKIIENIIGTLTNPDFLASLPLVAIFMATYIGGAILIAKKMPKNVGVFVFWGWLLMANIPCMYFAKYVSQTLGFWPS